MKIKMLKKLISYTEKKMLFFSIKSHVLSYLEIKYSVHHSLIEAVNL